MVINQNSSGGLIRQLGINPKQAASSPPLLINSLVLIQQKKKKQKENYT